MAETSATPISDQHLREYPTYTRTGVLMREFETKVATLTTQLADAQTELSHMTIANAELLEENRNLTQQLTQKGGSNA